MTLLARIKSLPWSQILLLVLIIVSVLNLAETRRLERAVRNNAPDSLPISITNDILSTANTHLENIEESVKKAEACTHSLRPIWCH